MARGDLMTKRLHQRSFIQLRERPDSVLQLFARNGGAMGGFEVPKTSPEAVYMPSLSEREAWELFGKIQGPPGDLPSTSFTERLPRETAAQLERLAKRSTPFTMHVVGHKNIDPQDYTTWEFKKIFSGITLSNYAEDDQEVAPGGDEAFIEVSADAALENYSRLFHLYFGAEDGTNVTKEIVAVAVYPPVDRGDEDLKELYAVQKTDTNPQLHYSKDGGATWTKVGLTGMSTNDPTDIAVVGSYVIITSNAGLGYYYANRDSLATWTAVEGTGHGFVTSKGPNAIYAPAVGEIWMVGDGGYVYKLGVPGQDVTVIDAGTLTAQNLAAIHGNGNTILAVGAANAAILTQNGGRSWAALTGPAAATALNDCWVLDDERFWIASDYAYYSLDEGDTWTQSSLTYASIASVQSILFCPDQPAVGYAAVLTSDPVGAIMRTSDHGGTWEVYSVHDLPSNEQINDLAVGGPNYVVAGGLVTAVGGDGLLALGVGGIS